MHDILIEALFFFALAEILLFTLMYVIRNIKEDREDQRELEQKKKELYREYRIARSPIFTIEED